MKNSFLNQLDHHRANNSHQRYQLHEQADIMMEETQQMCRRIIDDTTLLKQANNHFSEYRKKEEQSFLRIHPPQEVVMPSLSCTIRKTRWEELHHNYFPGVGVNKHDQSGKHHKKVVMTPPDDTISQRWNGGAQEGSLVKRKNNNGHGDFQKGSIIFDHLSEHRTRTTLLGALQHKATDFVPSVNHPHGNNNEDGNEKSDDPMIYGSMNDAKTTRKRSIYDYLAEHRARMQSLHQEHHHQSNMDDSHNKWDDDDLIDSALEDVDELIFEIEL